jgi:uncharacterized surface protein with fasciclin (FAS1) repeats
MRNRLAAGITTATLLAGGLAASTGAPASAAPGHRSLATVLAADGHHLDKNWHDFDIVDKAVLTVLKAKPQSPVGLLADGRVRLTAFVPTDAAFRRLVDDLTGHRPATERRTFAKVAGLADVDTLETILLYHVVPGAPITAREASRADGAKLETATGQTIRVNVNGHTIRLRDKDRDARNAKVLPAKTDINKGNRQIAHGITQVLRPVDL